MRPWTVRSLVAWVVVTIAPGPIAAKPWAARCRERFVKETRSLRAFGKVQLEVRPVAPPVAQAAQAALGQLRVTIRSGRDGVQTLQLGDVAGGLPLFDRCGTRPPPSSDPSAPPFPEAHCWVNPQYDTWHSPYEDRVHRHASDPAVLFEERHHQAGVVPASAVVAATGVDPAVARRFAAVVKPIAEACLADRTPEEADPSLPWTVPCLAALSAAHASLARMDPMFAAGTCDRGPYAVSCRTTTGAPPRWQAVTMSPSDGAPLAWTHSEPRSERFGGDVWLWADDGLDAAQYSQLASMFRPALETCARLRRRAAASP